MPAQKGSSAPQPITATVAPSPHNLLPGDLLNTITGFASLDSPGNYASEGGTITSVEWLVDGVDRPGTFAVTDTSSVILRVTDSAANERSWTIDSLVRHPFGTAPTLASQVWTVDDTVVLLDAIASGANLTFTYAASGLPGNATINPTTGAITVSGNGGAFLQADVGAGSINVIATDQYGHALSYSAAYAISLRALASAAGALSDQNWTVDDDAVDVFLAGDFTANGNNLSYAVTGLPIGLIDDGDGSISGTPTTDNQAGSITVTATDEYGRAVQSAFSYTTAYRSQAISAGLLGPFAFTKDVAIIAQNLASDFTANGNTLAYAISGSSLPNGLSVSSVGTLTGTPTVESTSSQYTVTATDEYGRTTASIFSLSVSEGASFNPEAGLTLSISRAPGEPLVLANTSDEDRSADVTIAADFVGLNGSSGGMIAEFGAAGNGAWAGFYSDGRFMVRCGSGAAEWQSDTSYFIASAANAPSGDGTLVVNLYNGPKFQIRAWWNGQEVSGTLTIATVDPNNGRWAGVNDGTYLAAVDGGAANAVVDAPFITAVPVTSASSMRVYFRQSPSV